MASRDPDALLCAACGEPTPAGLACAICGEPPLLAERYRLIEQVGQGATGTTFRGRTPDGAEVAVKEMPLGRAGVDLDRFEREARVLRELAHDRIPAYVDHFSVGVGKRRTLYLVQAFIAGPTLAEEAARRRYTEDDVLAILASICEVLGYLHALRPPVIHRDLKPGNLVRRGDGALVLIDFGAVRDVLRDPALGGSTVAGTYGYMAPEQFQGDAEPATDLYALGVVAVALLSRRDPVDLMKGHTLDWRPAVHASAETAALIERLLAPLAADRPASAAAVRAEILRLRQGPTEGPAAAPAEATTALALRPTPALPAVLPPRRQRTTAIALAFAGAPFGIHQWYLGRKARGILSAIFFATGIPTLVSIYDGIRMVLDGQRAFDEQFNPERVAQERAELAALMAQIEELHALKEKGALTEAEFRAQKARLLGTRQHPFGLLGGQFAELAERLESLPDQLLKRLDGKKRRWW